MGLDTVELLMALEDEFGIGITDAEAAKIITIGDTVDLIVSKIVPTDAVPGDDRSAAEFKDDHRKIHEQRITRICSNLAMADPEEVKSLEQLFPLNRRTKNWSELKSEIGPTLPSLARPKWLKHLIVGSALGLCIFTAYSTNLSVAIVTTPMWLILFLYATRRFKIRFPGEIETFRDLMELTWKHAPRSAFERVRREGYSRDSIYNEVVLLVCDHLGADPEQCHEDAEYIKDLGAG